MVEPMVGTALVDRKAPMDRLKTILMEVAEGKGRIVFLTGEAGVGKSKVAEALGEHARQEGFTFLYGRGLSADCPAPYLPFLEAFEHHRKRAKTGIKTQEDEGRLPMSINAWRGGDLGGAIPVGLIGLDSIFEEGRPGPGSEAKDWGMEDHWTSNVTEERDRMYEVISSRLFDIAKGGPVLMSLEEMHNADMSTLQLLVYIANSIKNAKLMILVEFRTEEMAFQLGRPQVLNDVISKIRRLGVSETITLDRFDKEDTGRLIEALSGLVYVDEKVVDQIHQRTHGNPFFIEELVKNLMGIEALKAGTMSSEIKDRISSVELPSSIMTVMLHRLSKVDERAHKVLEHSSVLGQGFDLQLLRTVSGLDEETLVEGLDILIRANILKEEHVKGVEIYSFTNELLRDVVYGTLSNTKKRLIHKRTALAIEARCGEKPGEQVYRLAYHYSNTGDLAKCAHYQVLAGKRAFDVFALDESARYFQSVLDTLEELGGSEENLDLKEEALLFLGMIHYADGELKTALKETELVLELTKKTHNKRSHALALLRKAMICFYWSDYRSTLSALLGAQELFEAVNDLGSLAFTHIKLSILEIKIGNHQKALEHGQRALEIAERNQNMKIMTNSHTLIAGIYSELGDFQQAERYFLKAVDMAHRIEDPAEISRALNNYGDLFMKQRQFDKALPILERSLSALKQVGNIRWRAYTLCNIGECLVNIGELEKARPFIDDAREILEMLNDRYMSSRIHMIEGIVNRRRKDWANAEKEGLVSIRVAEDIAVPISQAEYLTEYGITLKEEGKKEEAREALRKAVTLFKEIHTVKFQEWAEGELKDLEKG